MAKPQKPQTIKSLQADAARQAFPYYSPLLQSFAQNAGIQMPQAQPTPQPMPAQQQMARQGWGTATRFQGAAQPQPQPSAMQQMASIYPVGGAQPQPQQPQAGFLPNSALGPYGRGEDALRLQQAEEDINEQARQRARLLQFRLGQQGIGGSGTMAAALGQNERAAMDQFSDFRRQLAIGAGQEQERRLQLLAQMLGLGAGFGSQAQGVNMQQQQMAASKPGFLGSIAPFASMFSPIKF